MNLNQRHLVEVAPHIYLNKNDSTFLKRYLQYRPNDDHMVYAHAKELMVKGKTEEAKEAYALAASMGNEHAKNWLLETRPKPVEKPSVQVPMTVPQKKSVFPLWIPWVLLGVTGIIFLLSSGIWLNNYFLKQNHQSATIVVEDGALIDTKPLQQALGAYKESFGSYPDQISSLVTQGYLGEIPNGISYEKTDKGYILQQKGDTAMGWSSPTSLVFYPDEGKLALEEGDQVLALYPVAFGTTTGDLPKGEVTKKVVNPNGGNGVFGTRGLVLSKNIAIHGTNDPNTIGQEITKGCLRMYNEDIENIYPYIRVGTPYQIKSGQPQEPIYPQGMPELKLSKMQLVKDETPHVVYHWRN